MGLLGNFYGFLGYLNHSKERYAKAEAHYRRGVRHGMDSLNYQMAYGVLLLRTGSFQQARDTFSHLLITAPRKGHFRMTAKMNLALSYWKLGEVDTAVEMMEEVHQKLHNSKTYGALGYLLIAAGDLDKALAFNVEALTYDEDDPVVLDNLAQVYYALGNREEALQYFLKAEEEKGDQADTLYYLGCLYQEEGHFETAREKWEKALLCRITALSTISRQEIEEKLSSLPPSVSDEEEEA